MASKRKHNAHDLERKYQVVTALERGVKAAELARQYNIKPNTISDWKKSAEKIKEEYQNGVFGAERKKMRLSKYEDVDEATLMWFKNVRSSNIAVNGPILSNKAEELAKQFGHNDWKASSGWLERFKKRHGIVFKTICGESESVREEDTSQWYDSTLPTILQLYKASNIFNADETGLFWKCLPDKTMAFTKEPCHGIKKSKERLTVLVATNMDGSEKLPLLVIGKFKKPRCFKNVNSLPCEYTGQSSAWINSEIFTEWVFKLDRRFQAEKRKVALIVDNCKAHPKISGLQAITIYFLPPNTTSKTQPMDQGVIQMLKVNYRRALVRQHILALDQKREFKPNVLDALRELRSSWNKVTQVAIQNCWFHCLIHDRPADSETATSAEPAAVVEAAAAAEESGKKRREAAAAELAHDAQRPNPVAEAAAEIGWREEEFSAFVEIDDNVEVCGELTDETIVASIKGQNNIEEEDIDEEEQCAVPTTAEVADIARK